MIPLIGTAQNADKDLTSSAAVYTGTPSATDGMKCTALIAFGDGAKDLDGTGGDFEFIITVGGQTVQPAPQVITFGTEVRSAVQLPDFFVPANQQVIIYAKSPNAADTDVDVTAYLADAFPINVASGVVQSDLRQMGGVAQSATDLKDFADTGYDPTTHKVQGLVLADTVTTLTGHTPQTADHTANIAAILADTGTDGVVVAAGSKTGYSLAAAQTFNMTGNITGNLSGSVGSVTGAVGSVTGNVGGNVNGSVGSVAAGGITASSVASNTITADKIASNAITAAKIATDAIDADALAADAVAEIAAAVSTETEIDVLTPEIRIE